MYPVSDIKHIVEDAALMNKYDEFMVRRALATDADARWCPAPDCGYVCRDSTLEWRGASRILPATSPHRHWAAEPAAIAAAVLPVYKIACPASAFRIVSQNYCVIQI